MSARGFERHRRRPRVVSVHLPIVCWGRHRGVWGQQRRCHLTSVDLRLVCLPPSRHNRRPWDGCEVWGVASEASRSRSCFNHRRRTFVATCARASWGRRTKSSASTKPPCIGAATRRISVEAADRLPPTCWHRLCSASSCMVDNRAFERAEELNKRLREAVNRVEQLRKEAAALAAELRNHIHAIALEREAIQRVDEHRRHRGV